MITEPEKFPGSQNLPVPLLPTEPALKKRGRPELLTDDELLYRREILLNALETHWWKLAWKLSHIKTLPTLREVLAPLNGVAGFDVFTSADTQKSTHAELHALRRIQKGFKTRFYDAAQKVRAAQESLKRATDALQDAGRDAKLEQLCEQRRQKLDVVIAEQKELRREHDVAEKMLLWKERYIAQSEFLDFLESKRYSLNPQNIADALAGVPHITWRVSATRCRKHGPSRPPGFYYRMFLRVQKALQNPPRKAEQAVEQAREHLLKISPKQDSTVGYLRGTFYYLRAAIESAYKVRPPAKALPYAVFSEYQQRQSTRSRYDQVLQEEERLE